MAGLLAVLVGLLLPASASAADSIYWSRENHQSRSGTGTWTGRAPRTPTLFDDGGRPCGLALDPTFARPGTRPARCIGRTGTQGRSWTDPWWGPAPCSAQTLFDDGPATPAASRSTPRTTRSTGPTSAPTDSGRQPGRHGHSLDPVHRPGRKPPERGDDRPRGRQDLLDQPAHQPGPGRAPGRLGHSLDPVRQRR